MIKKIFFIAAILFCCNSMFGQNKPVAKEPSVPCTDQANADGLPGKYTDHTNPKYPFGLRGTTQDKALMIKQLVALEKLEETSRSNFQLTGCVARVSFSGGDKNNFGVYPYTVYGYQLGVYQNVCHVTQHVIKTVDEYRTVLRVNVNPSFNAAGFYGENGDFYITDKNVRYDIAVDAKRGSGYDKERINNPSRITRFISEEMVLTGRSDDYKNKHADFLKIINGEGYVENGWRNASRDARKVGTKGYEFIDRHYLITRPGISLLVPVTRKEYLESLLEYYEIEKANFLWAVAYKINEDSRSNSTEAKKRMTIYEADKAAYEKVYENKKTKIQQLLTTQKPEWLQKQAVVKKQLRENDYSKASNGLLDFNSFSDIDAQGDMLYQYNPEYFKGSAGQPVKPMLMEVQFRYELGDERGFSERLFNNFLKNYDMSALRKMLE